MHDTPSSQEDTTASDSAASSVASYGSGGRVTINEVAKAAGVSKATVSRFLNRRDALLTPDIAERVRKAIAELDYVPSPMARALKRGRSRLIGLIVADITNPYSVLVLRGIEKACKEEGYLVMLFNLGNEIGREREAIEALSGYQVEGFILNRVSNDVAAVAEAARKARPMVLVDRRNEALDADFVSLDNLGATRMAVAHLRDSGYREIVLVTQPMRNVSSRIERCSAFRASVREWGLNGTTFEYDGDDPASLEAALTDLRDHAEDRGAAVISGNAICTLRVATAVRNLGWEFGDQLGLVGFDDTEWSPLIGPGLTSIAQPTDELGRAAARCLFDRLSGSPGPAREILIPGTLVVRGSSITRNSKRG